MSVCAFFRRNIPMPKKEDITVLLADDEPDILELVKKSLASRVTKL